MDLALTFRLFLLSLLTLFFLHLALIVKFVCGKKRKEIKSNRGNQTNYSERTKVIEIQWGSSAIYGEWCRME